MSVAWRLAGSSDNVDRTIPRYPQLGVVGLQTATTEFSGPGAHLTSCAETYLLRSRREPQNVFRCAIVSVVFAAVSFVDWRVRKL